MNRFTKLLTMILAFVNFGMIAQVVPHHKNARCGRPILENTSLEAILENTKRINPSVYEKIMREDKNNSPTKIDSVGSMEPFYVVNFDLSGGGTTHFDTVRAELKKVGPNVQVWVDSLEWNNNHVTQAVVDSIYDNLEKHTPADSTDPKKGIVEIDKEFMGNPPDYDGDGLTDFLLTDIHDGWDGVHVTTFTSGYFWSNDQTTNSGSNERDILFIDTFPAIFNNGAAHPLRPLSTVAHEYQHLIHYNYDKNEVFINESFSENASLLCGYQLRSPERYFNNTNVPFFSWNTSDYSSLDHYSRAALFGLYIGEQFDDSVYKRVVRTKLNGRAGLDSVFSNYNYNTDFNTTFQNFLVTNYLNDQSVDSSYGYDHTINRKPKLNHEVRNSNLIINRNDLKKLSTHYVSYRPSGDEFSVKLRAEDTVKAFSLEYNPPHKVNSLMNYIEYSFDFSGALDSIVVPVANLSGKTQSYRLISTDNHNQTVWEHTGGPDPYNDSAFTSVNDLDSDSNGRLFAATESGLYRSTNQGGTWENLSDSYILSDVETVYDVTVDKKDYVYITTSDYELLRSTDNGDSWTELLIDYYYQNYHPWQTVVNPTTGNLYVCSSNWYVYKSTDNGSTWTKIQALFTDERLLSASPSGKVYASTSSGNIKYSSDNGSTWHEMETDTSLGNAVKTLYGNDNTLYVGSDEGIFMFQSSDSSWKNIGLGFQSGGGLYGDNTVSTIVKDSSYLVAGTLNKGLFRTADTGKVWVSMNYGIVNTILSFEKINVQLYTGTNAGVYKRISRVTSKEKDESSIPEKIHLSQNYPNPFNPSTTIRFTLNTRQKIKLQVFDVLGRRVDVLIDGILSPGRYEKTFNGKNLASGVYFYRLDAGGYVKTKKMILLR